MGLQTEKQRGDAFEVFVEAYLCTNQMVQTAEVWVIGKVPAEIRRQLNLPSKDYGYDGVFRTKLGELVPYQAKFRSGRTSLPYAELATFFGISEKAELRLVLTNSIAISKVAESRTGFQTTRGGDFDRLDAAQLAAIADWIDGVAPIYLVREPRPHQRAALNDIAEEFAAHDRATVVMACGTGKTLVALWAAVKVDPKRVLVLVPSLNLLRQTVHEWANRNYWGERFRYLCVCSDSKVASGYDDMEIRQEDLDFPVGTKHEIVSKFLNGGDGAVSVVFCTYQSAHVVGKAVNGSDPFDIGIFDEAHKTTGRDGTRFSFSLKDENLPIRKRLFLTATPRHYDIRNRDKEGEFAVASMDNEAIYGRVAHRLTFSQAAKQKIIVPYKIIISVVDSAMVDNSLLEQSEVVIKGDPVRAKWVAHQIALKHAVEEHDLKRVITFHSRIKAAASFASDGSEGIGLYLHKFKRFHVSGEQSTAERDEKMLEFARVQRGVITNARCLTEGVDVPSVDIVAFIDPRRSRVDIVQAVGRAMRRTTDGGKTCGYVLVPLYLEVRKGETHTKALERSRFDEIAQVLNAMRDNDNELSDIIQALTVEKGRTGGFDESRLRDRIEVLGPQVQLAELAASIRTRIVDELGITWDERYGQLVAYKDANGTCSVSVLDMKNRELGRWVSNQRSLFRAGTLDETRKGRLEKIGFTWDERDDAWETRFSELVRYKGKHGDCNVPRNWRDDKELARWVGTRRQDKKNTRIAPKREQRLTDLGFDWDVLESDWHRNFAWLSKFFQQVGNFNVPVKWPPHPNLRGWINTQRSDYKKGKMQTNHIALMEKLNFPWAPMDESWNIRYAELVAFKKRYGHCDVRMADNSALAEWVKELRRNTKRRGMSEERIAQLTALGFVWNPHDADWESQFQALSEYRALHGNCNVPPIYPANQSLGRWVGNQRKDKKSGQITEERITRLNAIGFSWDPFGDRWERSLDALVAYQKEYGDCNVPQKWKRNPSLGKWVSDQRKKWRDKTLMPEQQKRLEKLGFIWQPGKN